MRNENEEIFGRLDADGNVRILYGADREPVTCLYSDTHSDIYPVNSDLSVRYPHSNGIVLSRADAERLGIKIEE